VAYQDKYLLVYGGFSSEINPYVWAYNVNQKLGQGNWCKLKIDGATPPPHFAGGWEILDDDIYAFGGRINPNDSGE
jgi:hypothetical protein